MITCHCPKCDITFRHEDAEAVFCPKCQTTLCDKTSENDGVVMPENYQYNTIPVGLVVAFVVIVIFLLSLLLVLSLGQVWKIMMLAVFFYLSTALFFRFQQFFALSNIKITGKYYCLQSLSERLLSLDRF